MDAVAKPTWAVVLGGASCVWDDLDALERETGEWPGLVIIVNDIGCHVRRRVDHWVTLTPERFAIWIAQRLASGCNRPTTWTRVQRFPHGGHRTLTPWGDGSSGLLAGQLAHELGCDKVVFCGVPMEPTPHFRESRVHRPDRGWRQADHLWPAWLQVFETQPGFRTDFRSMSGRTRALLGSPTLDWLHEHESSSTLHDPNIAHAQLS